jgi:hypothetical protein
MGLDPGDISEIEGPMSKVSPWWRGALQLRVSYLKTQQAGKWYIGVQGIPKAHAIIGIRVCVRAAEDLEDLAAASTSAEEHALLPEVRIID